jgi:hypothetical protein
MILVSVATKVMRVFTRPSLSAVRRLHTGDRFEWRVIIYRATYEPAAGEHHRYLSAYESQLIAESHAVPKTPRLPRPVAPASR